MSDQPKPMTEDPSEHEFLYDVCQKCGVSAFNLDENEPCVVSKPTTGEWTAETVRELWDVWDDKPMGAYRRIADSHNAALAAAQGAQHHMEACRALLNVPDDEVLYGAIEELQQQLAAEREKVQPLVDALKAVRSQCQLPGRKVIDAALAKVREGKWSDQPAGEWTVDDEYLYAGVMAFWIGDPIVAKRIADAHNAALAAERTKVRPAIFDPEHYPEDRITQLEQQLAAAQGAQHHMEACRALLNVPDDEVLYGAIEELQQQLAAERENLMKLERDWHKVINEVLKCSPIPAKEREDGQLEPPWEVIARLRNTLGVARDALAAEIKKREEMVEIGESLIRGLMRAIER